MNSRDKDRTLALAGVFQAARLVQQLARHGQADSDALRSSINSILITDADSTDAVYGGVQGTALGLENLKEKLSGTNGAENLELARYVLAIIQLAGKLGKQGAVLNAIRQGIETIASQMAFFSAENNDKSIHPTLMAKLAELYTQTVSTLTPRIMVNGEHGYLSNPTIANSVRAALLAGIRSAFLWRQLGGSRWQLLFNRNRIVKTAEEILRAV